MSFITIFCALLFGNITAFNLKEKAACLGMPWARSHRHFCVWYYADIILIFKMHKETRCKQNVFCVCFCCNI